MEDKENAKAYNKALEAARKELNIDRKEHPVLERVLGNIFPELAESEDERIGNVIYCIVRDNKEVKRILEGNGISVDNALAWLEKQKELFESGIGLYYYDGEKTVGIGYPTTEENPYDFDMSQQEKQKENPKNAISIPSDCVSDAKCEDRWHKVGDSLPNNGRLVLANDCLGNTLLARYDGEGNWEVSVYDAADYYCRNTITKWCEIPLEKQKEQRPTPKFKIGDVVRDTNHNRQPVYRIVFMDRECYICESDDHSLGDRAVVHFTFDNPYLRLVEQKPAEKQDYSGLNDLERAIHRGFLSAGVENVPVTIIKETAKECLAQMKPAEYADDVVEEAEEYTSKVDCGEYGVAVTEAYIAGVLSERNRGTEWSEDYRGDDIQTRFAFYTYKDDPSVLYLSNVFVEETSRNHGFGTRILKAAEKAAEAIGAITIRLKVKQDSPANAWYRKNGYGYVAFEDGYDWLEKNLEYMKPNNKTLPIEQQMEAAMIAIRGEMPSNSQEWSEEDEEHLKWLCRIIHSRRVNGELSLAEESELGKWIDKWLNHEPRPKAEWSEKDENTIQDCIRYLLGQVVPLDIFSKERTERNLAERLKSIRPQPKQEQQIKEGDKVSIHCRKDRREDIITIYDGKVGEVIHVWDAKRNPWGHIGVRLDNGCNNGFYEDELEVLDEPHWKPSEEQNKLK